MGTKRISDSREVLTLKLGTVHRFIEIHETFIGRLRGTMLARESNPQDDAADLLVALRSILNEIGQVGVPKSAIEADLASVRKSLGLEYEKRIGEGVQSMLVRMSRIARYSDSSEKEAFVSDVTALADDMIAVLQQGLEPAIQLRDEWIEALNRTSPQIKLPSEEKPKKRRDDRIRKLAREHETKSTAEVLKLAENDPIIQEIGEKVTTDIVRVALKRRRTRQSGKGK